jgi:uncharacterized protein YecE (DUF72 family)
VKDELWRIFLEALAPLKTAGKLGYLLVQLPPWGTKNRAHVAHVEECLNRLDGYQVALEFRNATWLSDDRSRASTVAMLREFNVPMVIVDEPQGFGTSIPAVWEATSPDLAVMRFHGRNKETWAKRNVSAAERFNYLYSEDELQELSEPVRRLASQTKQVHAMFNNCYEDKAVRNARQFAGLI